MQVRAWAGLPPYAITSLACHVCELAHRQQLRAIENYNTVEVGLLQALAGLVRDVSDFDEAEEKEQYSKQASLVARHAVLLLSRAPSCPPLAKRPTSTAAQRSYDALLPLLQRAGMSSTDLYGTTTGSTTGRMMTATAAGGKRRQRPATSSVWK